MLKLRSAYLLFPFLFSFVTPFKLSSQEIELLSDAALADKIYLQTDGQVYTQDQTLWFKAIVVNANDHKPSRTSGVLYVDLINTNEEIHESKIINVEGGVGAGFFSFDKELTPGLYMLRAYTEWNRNFGEGHYFKEYIHVYPRSADYKAESAIQNVVLEEKGDFYSFKAYLNPMLLDSLHKRRLSVYLTLDEMSDSLRLRPSGEDLYLLEYDVSKEVESMTVKLKTDNEISYSQTFQVNKDAIDLQFFPEGGQLVNGQVSKVGFKATAVDGKGVEVEGEIVDQDRKVLSHFKSNSLGMGTVVLMADQSKQYFARVSKQVDRVETSLLYPFPEVEDKGAVISIRKESGQIQMRVGSSGLQINEVIVEIGSRGINYLVVKRKLDEFGQFYLTVPEDELPDGIISFVLKDGDGRPIAQRLYFNEVLNRRLDIKVATDKKIYSQRDKSRLKSRVEDGDGNPVEASVSMMVINKAEMGEIQEGRHNILTYLLMGSELNGNIEKPAQYFDTNNPNRFAEMDALMLTQGWSRYNYVPMELSTPVKFMPEQKIGLSGTITGGISGDKPLEGIQLTMTTMSDPPSFDMIESDSLGRFSMDIADSYEGLIPVVFKSQKKEKARTFNLNLDSKTNAPIRFDHRREIERIDSIVYQLSLKQQERELIELAFDTTARDLGEVVIEDYLMTPLREEVIRKHGEPEVVIDNTEIMEKKPEWSNRLYDLLQMRYPEYFRVRRVRTRSDNPWYQGKEFDHLHIHGSDAILIMVDGIFVRPINYDLISEIPMSEIKSFEIIRQPDTFRKQFVELFGVGPLVSTYSYFSVYTYAGKGIFGVQKPKGIYQEEIPVFSPLREFYVPKYETLTPESWVRPDYRALIHWSPNHFTDEKGEVETEFYNADLLGEMLVVVEAISADGRIGYQEFSYGVEKRKR